MAAVALYPLRTRPLAVGLLAASAAGAWPLANLAGLLGVTVGLARGALGVLVAVIAVPLLAAASFGLAVAARSPGEGFVALAAGLAGLGAALATANIFTVVLPYPMAKRAGSPMPQAAQGCGAYALGSVLGTLACAGAAAAPVIVAASLTSADPAGVRVPVLVLGAAAYGFALAWAGVRVAARAAGGKLPELCQAAIRSTLWPDPARHPAPRARLSRGRALSPRSPRPPRAAAPAGWG